MIIQEYIADLLTARVPDGWEDMDVDNGDGILAEDVDDDEENIGQSDRG